jgi:hypothetical protein
LPSRHNGAEDGGGGLYEFCALHYVYVSKHW